MPSKTQSTAPVADATYPADAIEAALAAYLDVSAAAPFSELQWNRMIHALAAFDAAMLAHGWKRVRVVELKGKALLQDAAPEVKP